MGEYACEAGFFSAVKISFCLGIVDFKKITIFQPSWSSIDLHKSYNKFQKREHLKSMGNLKRKNIAHAATEPV